MMIRVRNNHIFYNRIKKKKNSVVNENCKYSSLNSASNDYIQDCATLFSTVSEILHGQPKYANMTRRYNRLIQNIT